MERGYVKLWRKSLDDYLWQNINLWRFFEYCLLKASHKDHKIMVGMQEITLKPGQFVFGRKVASEESGLSEQTIRTCMAKLKNMKKLTIKTTNKFSIISVINWGRYQDEENEINQQTNQQVTNKQPQTRMVKNGKETYTVEFERFWGAYPRKVNKKKAFEAWQKLNGESPSVEELLKILEGQKKNKDWVKDGGRFIPHPSTWLNGRRWEDEGTDLTYDDKPPYWD